MVKDVSIIIPVYNAEKHVHKCMESVLGQTFKNIEVIVVDDGSTDASAELCDAYAQRDNRVKVIHKENGGVSGARNLGLSVASGKYIVFLDIDDGIDENLIEDNYNIMESCDVDFVIFSFRYFYPERNEIVHNNYKADFVGTSEEFFEKELTGIVDRELLHAPWNKMIKRDFLISNNIVFDTRYSIYEDITFSVKLCEAARRVAINSKEYYTYIIWTQGTLRTAFRDNNFEAATELYNNARRYCNQFDNHREQMERFDLLYSGSIIKYIKTVCLNDELEDSSKKKLIREICKDKQFVNVLRKTRFQGTWSNRLKKKIIKTMIVHGNIRLIIWSYLRLEN